MRPWRVVAALVAGSCTLDVPPPPTPGAALALDCGTLLPALTVACNDGAPDRTLLSYATEPVAVAAGVESARELTTDCDLGDDPGRAVTARLRASCAELAGGGALTARLVLEAHVERRCGRGGQGSEAVARPVWRFSLGNRGTKRYAALVSAEATSDLRGRCELSTGGVAAQPLLGPSAIVGSNVLSGGDALAYTLDCNSAAGLAGSSCFGFVPGGPTSPDVAVERVILTLRVAER